MNSSDRARQILAAVYDGGTSYSGVELPQRLVDACVAAVGVTGVTLAVSTASTGMTAVASSVGMGTNMAEVQSTLGEGPSLDALATGRPVLQEDVVRTGSARWPQFVNEAAADGVAAVFAFPLQVGAIRMGSLDLYRDVTGPLDAAGLTEALAFADAAVTMLLEMQMASGPDAMPAAIDRPLENRREIHLATGIIAVQADVLLADALVLLRANAFSSERPVLEVARDVLDHAVRFDG